MTKMIMTMIQMIMILKQDDDKDRDTDDDDYKYVNFSLQFNSKKDLKFFIEQLSELHKYYWAEAYD